MAKQPKFLKNFLTTASTVALLSLSATSAMAGNARGVFALAADGTGLGLDIPAGGGVTAVANGDSVKVRVNNSTLNIANADAVAGLSAIDVAGNNFTFTQDANIALGPIVNSAPGAGEAKIVVAATRTYTLNGAPKAAAATAIIAGGRADGAGNAIAAADVEFAAGTNDYSGAGDFEIGNGGTLEVRQQNVGGAVGTVGKNTVVKGKVNAVNNGGRGTLDVISGNGGGGSPQKVIFEELIGNTNALNKIRIGGNTTAVFKKSIKMDGTQAANGGMTIANNSKVILEDGADLTSANTVNNTYVHGTGPGEGGLVFMGDSTIDVASGIGTNAAGNVGNALRTIEIGGIDDAGNVQSGKVTVNANTPQIIAQSIVFNGEDAALELGAVAQTVIAQTGITGTQVGGNSTGIVIVNGNNVVIKTPVLGGNADATKLEAIAFMSDHKLTLQTKDSGAAAVPPITNINVDGIATQVNNQGTLSLGLGTVQNIVSDIGADNFALKRLVLHSDDGAGNAQATFNLAQNKKIYAQTVNLSGSENVAGAAAPRNNKLVLINNSGVFGNVETGVDAAGNRIGGNLGEIHVNGTETFVTGNIGDVIDARGAIKAIIFDAAGDISIGKETTGGNVVNTTDGIRFDDKIGIVKFLRRDADITVNAPIIIAAGNNKGTLDFAAGAGQTVTIKGRVIENIPGGIIANAVNPVNADTRLAMIKTAGANVSIDATTFNPIVLGKADRFIVDTINLGDVNDDAEIKSKGGTLEFKTFAHGEGKGILHLDGGDIVVAEGGNGIGKIKGIKFSQDNSLRFKAGQGDLSLSDKLTANDKGIMVFEKGNTKLIGDLGVNEGGRKLGGLVIGVGINETSVEIANNAYLVRDVTVGSKGTAILSGTKLSSDNGGIKATNLAATLANGEGKIKFNNTEAFTYDAKIGIVAVNPAASTNVIKTIEIAGGDVKITKDAASQELQFTNKDKAATVEFTGIAQIVSATTTSTTKNHNVKVDVTKVAGLTPNTSFGTKDNQMGTLILAGDGPFNIQTAKFFSSVAPTANNLVDLTLSGADGGVYNKIGTQEFAVKSLTIDANRTIGDVNAKKITINDTKTATFSGKVNSEEGMTLGTAAAVAGGGGNVKFVDGSELATKIMTAKDGTGIATFEGAAKINEVIGASDKKLERVTITGTADKIAQLYANVFTTNNLTIKYTKISAEKTPLKFTSAVTGENDTLDLASGGIKFTSGVSGFTGKTAIITTFDGTDVGQIATENAGVKVNFTGATDGSTIEVESGGNARIKDAKIVSIKKEGDADSINLGDKFTIVNDAENPIKAKIVDLKKGSIEISDNSASANDKILEKYGVDALVRENANAWFGAKGGEAKDYADEVFQLLSSDPEKAAESQKRLSNPIVNSTEAVSLVNAEIGNIITSRIQTVANPAELRVSSIEGVSAGEEDVMRYGVWASPFLNHGRQKAKSGVSGFRSKSTGGTVGFDVMANDTMTIGLAATMARTTIKHKDTNIGDKTNANTLMFSIYGLQQIDDQFFLQGVASFGSTKIKNRALRIGFKPGAGMDYSTAVAKYDSMTWGGEVVGGYNVRLNDMAVVTPMVGIDYTRINDSGYTETGTRNQNQTVNKRVNNNIQLLAGARGVMAATNFSDFIVTPEVHAFVRQNLRTKTPQVTIKLDGQASPVKAKVAKQSKTLFNIGGGLNMTSGSLANTEFGITYDANFAKKYTGHQGAIKVRINFAPAA